MHYAYNTVIFVRSEDVLMGKCSNSNYVSLCSLNALSFLGGWWWHDACGENNLNGKYNKPRAKTKPERKRGICWKSQNGRLYSVKSTKMLIHPTD